MLIQKDKYSINQNGEMSVLVLRNSLPQSFDMVGVRHLLNDLTIILKAQEQAVRDSQKIGADNVKSEIS